MQQMCYKMDKFIQGALKNRDFPSTAAMREQQKHCSPGTQHNFPGYLLVQFEITLKMIINLSNSNKNMLPQWFSLESPHTMYINSLSYKQAQIKMLVI